MATAELEREARNNRNVGTKDEDEALVRSSCREENHSTGGRRDDGRRGVLAVCTLYFVLCTCRIVLYFLCKAGGGGGGGSISIREKMVRWRVVRRARPAIVSGAMRLRVISDPFHDLAVRLPCYGTHDAEAHPLVRFEQQVAQAFPNGESGTMGTAQGQGAEPQTNHGTRLSSTRGSNCRPIGGASDSQSRTHGASRMIWRRAGLWPRREHHIASFTGSPHAAA
jgi:hypothetical protein